MFIRLCRNRVQIAPGTADSSFDFRDLEREIAQAVKHGKLYSLAIKAGSEGTPAWIFKNGVTPLALQDAGSDNERTPGSCGPRMTLGSPTDPAFQKHYFDMLTKVADRIRARADWFRALAYIKPAGANLFSHENRLPKRCDPGCICNTQVFAEHGYTPSKLYQFYRKQFALLKQQFPGKAISYQLIQDGFPPVNDAGGYERADGSSSSGRPLPGGVEQTEHILEMGQEQLGSLFVVQHNGLQVYRTDCAEPAGGRAGRGGRGGRAAIQANRGGGCPNRWVLRAGADGKTITGFQTQNLGDINTPADIDLALKNAWVNSDASFVEFYEAPLWLAATTNNGILPSRRTIAQWANDFHERRRKQFSSMGESVPVDLPPYVQRCGRRHADLLRALYLPGGHDRRQPVETERQRPGVQVQQEQKAGRVSPSGPFRQFETSNARDHSSSQRWARFTTRPIWKITLDSPLRDRAMAPKSSSVKPCRDQRGAQPHCKGLFPSMVRPGERPDHDIRVDNEFADALGGRPGETTKPTDAPRSAVGRNAGDRPYRYRPSQDLVLFLTGVIERVRAGPGSARIAQK